MNCCFLIVNWGTEMRTATTVAISVNYEMSWFSLFLLHYSPAMTAHMKARKMLTLYLRQMLLLLICMAQWSPAEKTLDWTTGVMSSLLSDIWYLTWEHSEHANGSHSHEATKPAYLEINWKKNHIQWRPQHDDNNTIQCSHLEHLFIL